MLAAAADKVDEPETMKAILAQAKKLKSEEAWADEDGLTKRRVRAILAQVKKLKEGTSAEEDEKDMLAIAAYLRDGTITEGYTFTN